MLELNDAIARDERNRHRFSDAPANFWLEIRRLTRRKYRWATSGYDNTLSQLVGYLGARRRIQTITKREAEAFIATRQRQDGRPGELSSWARARHVIHARALFSAAMAWGYLESNPFRSDAAGGQSALRVNPKGRAWHHLTPEEFRRMLAVVESVQKRACFWLMYACGLRPGEAYNVMVANIDLENRRIHIVNRDGTPDIPPFRIKAEGQSTETKERSVPIPEAAIPDLTEAMKQSFKAGGFLVLTPERFAIVQAHWRLSREGKAWGNRKAQRQWQNKDMLNNLNRDTKVYLRQAGIELTASFNLHAFRKSFAQNHADAGTPPRTLAKLLGHSNTRVTMQFYNRVTDANERAAGKAMDQLLNAATKSSVTA